MKKGKTLSFVNAIGFLTILFISACTGCKTESDDPFKTEKFNLYDQNLGARITAYQNKITTLTQDSKKGSPALYIDFSSGINKAFNNPLIEKMMSECFNTVLARQFEVYKLGSHKISFLNVTNTTELGQKVSDPSQYADIWAPIQAAVEKIVDGNQDALLITDFEEWQNNQEVTNTAFLKIPFSKWLEKGNTIHFFIAEYKEGTVEKHIYFTVFNSGNQTPESMISKLETKLASLTTRFDLSSKSYKLSTDYSSEKSGGIFYDTNAKSDKARNVLDLKPEYINGLAKGLPFEFYPLGLDWDNIAQLHSTYSAENQFTDLFRKLYVNLNNNDSYNFGEFGVKVSDVTADFESFVKYQEAKNHKPKLEKGTNGETKISDKENDAFARACYDNSGKMKKEWMYTPLETVPLQEVFTLNQILFKNTRNADEKRVELGVAFDPKFNLKNIPNSDGLLKVDILVNRAEANLSNPKLEKFKWINVRGVANIALFESIKNTLQEIKPENQTVYSYYIKTNNN